MSTHYVKIPRLKKIIDAEDENCEKKLENIRTLIGESPQTSQDSPAESSGGNLSIAAPLPADGNANKFDIVLNEISGINEKKLATSLLQQIESSSIVSWSPETKEISIDGSVVRFTNIVYLIRRVISNFPASLPLGIVLFSDALLRMKLPMSLIKVR